MKKNHINKQALLGFVLALALAFICAVPGHASTLSDDEQPILALSGDTTLSLARVDVVALPVEVTPASIETGIACGMTEMCGQDPCLCGAVDAWGACACNGTQETFPTFSLACDTQGVVALISVFDQAYVVSLGSGSTHATLTATLPHYTAAQMDMQIEVAPFGILDALKILVALVVCAGVLIGIVALIKVLVQGVRRLVNRVKPNRKEVQ